MKNNCSTFAEIKGFEDPNDEKKFGEFAQKNIRTEFKKKDLI